MPESAIRILFIEDDPDLLHLLGGLLPVFGFETECAQHGAAGLAKLRRGPLPNLIVLDWFMPVLSGEEFLRAQKADAQLSEIPVIVMSGAKDIARILQDRPDIRLILEKPVGIDDLVQAIASVLPGAKAKEV